MPKVLLTGANGFVGSHVFHHFIGLGWDIVITLRSDSNCWRIESQLSSVNVVNLDEVALEKIFLVHEIDCVVHLATLYRKNDDLDELESLIESNVVFPHALVAAAQKAGVRAFINTGTFFEYPQSNDILKESADRKPVNNYAATKIAFSKQLEKYKAHMGIVELVLFSPYGPADNDKLIPYVVKNLLEHQSPKLQQGNNQIDLVYVADIAKAFEKAVSYVIKNGPGFDRINIASGGSVTVKDVGLILQKILNSSAECEYGELDKPSRLEADVSKAKSLLGWVPATPLEQGLENTVRYYKEDLQ